MNYNRNEVLLVVQSKWSTNKEQVHVLSSQHSKPIYMSKLMNKYPGQLDVIKGLFGSMEGNASGLWK